MINKDQPIYVPTNPFWQVFKTFGRDELIAGILSFVATSVLSFYFYIANISYECVWIFALTPAIWLAIVGPLFEKFGFFVGHIYDALDIYKTTPNDERKPFSFYAKNVFKGGGKSLLEDILVHDPIYIFLMLGGMCYLPHTPAWLLVPFAFIIAVLVVAGGEVAFNEIRYKLLIRRLSKLGFERESYLESHFIVRTGCDNPSCPRRDCQSSPCCCNPEALIKQLRDKFLPGQPINTLEYRDKYFETALPSYNARAPKVRLRKRNRSSGSDFHTLQIVYTRSIEQQQETSQFRFFPILKDKFYLMLSPAVEYASPNDIIPCTPGRIGSQLPLKENFALQNTKSKFIQFTRRETHSPERMLISVDTLKGTDNVHIIELKAYYNNRHLLKEAMRFAMLKFPILQTTYSKSDLRDYSEFDEILIKEET
jgi:hypothetical protein